MTMTQAKLVLVLLLLAAALVVGAPAPLPRPTKEEDLKRLQGTWVRVASFQGGKPFPKSPGRLEAVVKGDNLAFYWDGKLSQAWTVTLDAKAKPKTLDLSRTIANGKTFGPPAVYALDGDTLKICYGSEKRPTDLSGAAPTDRLVVWRRKKP
jgi:uncharacterized protein (TIGR03067 family)